MPFPVPGRIAESLRRSTVQVRYGSAGAPGGGSGVILNDGRILTNAHVVSGGAAGNATVEIEAWDGRTQRVRIARTDPRGDLALLVAEKLDAPEATLAATPPRAGQAVIAVGNPLGFIGAVSTGFIHNVGAIRGLGARSWIQADVRLAPGNSGGPLADIHGHIVGVNTMIAGGFHGGLALAIPAAVLQGFLSGGTRQRSLGVLLRPVKVRSTSNPPRSALMILELTPNGPAERASLLPGDLLLRAQNRPLDSPDDLASAMAGADLIHLDFLRSGNSQVRRVTVQLAAARTASAA